MAWHATLQLNYRRDGECTTALDRHEGPLRVLQRLYPEGPGICHHVLVHPPGGIVGGDTLTLDATLQAGSHALITTPGATRFYRSGGDTSEQRVTARLADGARLEWLPLETIAYSGCKAHNSLRFELAPEAQMIGWDVLALGLPAADQAFDKGRFLQQLELPGVWLERGAIDATDTALLDSPLGWAGRRVLATLWFASGSVLQQPCHEALLASAREQIEGDTLLAAHAGVTLLQERVVVLRALALRVEPAMQLLMKVRAAWRHITWGADATAPRVWST
jgi:urease accessory protein